MSMTSHQRVLSTLQFEPVDRVAYDLMEGAVWPELEAYFCQEHGLSSTEQVLDFLDTDFRWVGLRYVGPDQPARRPAALRNGEDSYSKKVFLGPLAEAQTVADVEAYEWPDPAWWQPADYAAARQRWPDHALVFVPGWRPLLWSACEAFGVEQALVNMLTAPKLFDAFIRQQHAFYVDFLSRGLEAARGHCDICWLGDDFASQHGMMVSPDLWRRHIKPYLAEQVQLARDHDMYVLYHSCGAVRPVLPDLIDIGVNALLVFQTTAAGMDPASIATEFGGRLAFYGGMDVQHLLSFGTVEQVQAQVRANVAAFSRCGGYIVANSHHRVLTINGGNILAMCEAARQCTNPFDGTHTAGPFT